MLNYETYIFSTRYGFFFYLPVHAGVKKFLKKRDVITGLIFIYSVLWTCGRLWLGRTNGFFLNLENPNLIFFF
jgi:hypothetical protein